MVSQMPLPVPPRTPTPPPDEPGPDDPVGLGLEGQLSPSVPSFNPTALSPMSATFPSERYGTLGPGDSASQRASPAVFSPASATFPRTPASAMSGASVSTVEPPLSGSDNTTNPFNFQSVQYMPGRTQSNKPNDVGRRRGHKYKHSSVSHQIFLEPPPRAPLQLPASLPIPTFKEYRRSTSREQDLRVAWCFCHLSVAGMVAWGAKESLLLTVLSRLIFYDALSACLCVAVDIGSNFEVWKRSTIRYPFGLKRLEVLAGLAMSVGLLFMGLDLISHGLTHALENTGGHKSHHAHEHERVSPGSIDLMALSAIACTLTSALALKNHARIGKVMQLRPLATLPSVLSNPSHLLTLSCSTLLLLLPLLSIQSYIRLDKVFSFSVAIAMVALGWAQGWTLGKMLMMSYSGPGVKEVMYEIETDPSITALEMANFWQVHYGLAQANIKLRVRHLEEVGRVRERIGNMIRNRLGGSYGSGGLKWDVSIQCTLEKD